MSNDEETSEDYSRLKRETLKSRVKKQRRMIEKIERLKENIKKKISTYYKSVEKSFDGMKNTVFGWFKERQDFYENEETMMSDISEFEDYEKSMKLFLQDLTLISDSLGAKGVYNSPISKLRRDLGKSQEDLKKQKGLVKKENKKRQKLERDHKKEIERLKGKTTELEGQVRKLKKGLDGVDDRIDTMANDYLSMKAQVDSILSPEFAIYFFNEISKFGIPDVNIQWKDEGIDHILTSELYSYSENEFRKLIEVGRKKPGDEGFVEILHKKYNEIVEGLEKYVKDPDHAKNIRTMRKSLQKAKFALIRRKQKDLIWCGYGQHCSFICPGFKPNETYCEEKKDEPYNTKRIGIFAYLIDRVDTTLKNALEIEKNIPRK